MLNDNIKNAIMEDIENAVYNLYIDELNKHWDDMKDTRSDICDFISNYLMERAIEERRRMKNL